MLNMIRAIPLKSGEGEREFLSLNKWDSPLEKKQKKSPLFNG